MWYNKCGQLGIASNKHIYEPILVSDLENKFIVDIKSSMFYSIAIFLDNNPKFMIIITNLARLYSLSQDIINLIISFTKMYIVFATTTRPGTGHLKDDKIVNKAGWNMVNSLIDKNIIKCDVCEFHSMFLEDNGVLWAYGYWKNGLLGLGLNFDEFMPLDHIQDSDLLKPTKIPYFIKNKIVIKDVKCGARHNIAFDKNTHVYSWGYNAYGQCGHGMDSKKSINAPKSIESLIRFVIYYIDCRCAHSYVNLYTTSVVVVMVGNSANIWYMI